MARLIFSTGVLYLGPAGNTALDSSNQIGLIQDGTFKDAFSREEAFDSSTINVSALDAEDSEAKATFEFSALDINLAMLVYTSGADSRSVTVDDVARTEYTAGALSVPPYARLEFHGKDTTGKLWDLIATKVKLTGTDISTGRKKYTEQKYTADMYFDPNATSPNDASAVPTRYFLSADN